MKRGNSNAVGIVTLVTLGGVQCTRDAILGRFKTVLELFGPIKV